MKILYYDCFSGISGDMNLGAMVDLGVPLDYLTGELKKIDIGSYEIIMQPDKRKGIAGTRIKVAIPQDIPSHQHRTFHDISGLIQKSSVSENVKTISLKIFEKLARAEAHVHNHAIEDVRFHEVGAVDSIVDIVGAAICFDYFKADRIISSPVQVGGGFVKCAHGTLPVPAPATAEILKGIPVKSGLVPFETATPTGAAILAAMADTFTENIKIIAGKIGYGIGQRDTEVPNILRVYLGDMDDPAIDKDIEQQEACLVECNIDDMNPELYSGVLDALFEKGAYDAYLIPIIMKKSRPAVKISILCGEAQIKDIEEILWRQTTTFGLRIAKVRKKMLRRDFSKQLTKYGEVTVKNAYFKGKKIKSKPEYEDCRRLAGERGVSIKDIYDSLNKDD
ncbi:MAG TPA: nickel pincer cofactor biosynthesis protein LarC [Smithella sp.]|nr:nickel pincer cofactor biosynthesis protein LarC [Smithella sp.]